MIIVIKRYGDLVQIRTVQADGTHTVEHRLG
jgi:hypothetical protein